MDCRPSSTTNALRDLRRCGIATLPRSLLADLALLCVTFIWGGTFVLVKDAVSVYPVFSFLTLRFAFAALPLLVIAGLRQAARRRAAPSGIVAADVASAPWAARLAASAVPLLPSLCIGVALFAGYALQTAGLRLTTPAKAGFITGLSVVVVPLVAALLLRERPGPGAWLGVGSALVGLALLTLRAGLSIQTGDLLVLGCSVAFAGHILLTGRFAPRHNPLLLTLGQILVVAVFSGLATFLFEPRALPTGKVLLAAAFTGLLCTTAAFGAQTVAQRFTTTTHTALIFATEPVFAALASLVLVGEVLGPAQLAGCALILAGMVAAELGSKRAT